MGMFNSIINAITQPYGAQDPVKILEARIAALEKSIKQEVVKKEVVKKEVVKKEVVKKEVVKKEVVKKVADIELELKRAKSREAYAAKKKQERTRELKHAWYLANRANKPKNVTPDDVSVQQEKAEKLKHVIASWPV
jgi:predicted  nucleic acid-binding Zn-ribbon protein